MIPHHHDRVAFVNGTTHKFLIEQKAKAVVELVDDPAAALTAFNYIEPIYHPWPREFGFHYEFMAYGLEPELSVDLIHRHLPASTDEHVLLVFAESNNSLLQAYADLGYQHCRNNSVMGVDLSRDVAWMRKTGLPAVRPAKAQGDIEAINVYRPEYEASKRALADPAIYDFCIWQDERVVAAAQVVVLPEQVEIPAYISGMFTEPESRQRGCCTALMRVIHEQLITLGIERCVLVPSEMANEIDLYARYGYRESVPMMVLIPNPHSQNYGSHSERGIVPMTY